MNAEVATARASLSDDLVRAKLELAKELHTEAQYHKREAARHKRAMVSAYERFERFRRDLEALGIKVIIEQPQSPRRQSDGNSSTGGGR